MTFRKNSKIKLDHQKLNLMANAIRVLSADAVERANSGHPGMPLGTADIATILFSYFLKFDPNKPKHINRDRFILSAGHGSMLLYSLSYLLGYKDINIEDLKNFRQLDSKTAGHPELGYLDSIETTTGPLGQGLANAVGFAIAEAIHNAKNAEIIDNYTYVLVGDGCLMEGISHEAISLAGHLKLKKLIVLFDDNKICIDGPTDLTVSDNQEARFKASNWNVTSIDGHDFDQIYAALEQAKQSDRPSFIACRTVIAKGAGKKAGTEKSHGAPLGGEDMKNLRDNLNWSHKEFEIPSEILDLWRQIGENNGQNLKTENASLDNDFKGLDQLIDVIKQRYSKEKPNWATRKSSGDVIEELTKKYTNLIGGSADLTGSNLTKASHVKAISADDFKGNYIYYGVREHAMAAIMNGISLYGGFVPFGGTFLVFSDYCRPAIRLSALMERQVVYVFTHDSIGLGEDGPTHQPVEHLAALRAIPNLNIFRPCDAIEVAECWELALQNKNTPSILALSRQNLPVLTNYSKENNSSKGAYILREAEGELQVTIFASGSEVEIAVKAGEILQSKNIGTRIISVPCMELYEEQAGEYKVNLTCNNSIKVAIEAAIKLSWEKFIGPHGIFVGMKGFGASAPASDLYKKFNITAEYAVNQVLKKLEDRK